MLRLRVKQGQGDSQNPATQPLSTPCWSLQHLRGTSGTLLSRVGKLWLLEDYSRALSRRNLMVF